MTIKRNVSMPPRPKCTCGNPATHKVTIEIAELELIKSERHRKYWGTSYDDQSSVNVLLCETCMKSNVSLNVTASTYIAAKP